MDVYYLFKNQQHLTFVTIDEISAPFVYLFCVFYSIFKYIFCFLGSTQVVEKNLVC